PESPGPDRSQAPPEEGRAGPPARRDHRSAQAGLRRSHQGVVPRALRPLLTTRLERSGLWDLDCFDVAHVRDLLRRHREGHSDLSTRLWCLLNLALWYDDWIGHSPGSRQ